MYINLNNLHLKDKKFPQDNRKLHISLMKMWLNHCTKPWGKESIIICNQRVWCRSMLIKRSSYRREMSTSSGGGIRNFLLHAGKGVKKLPRSTELSVSSSGFDHSIALLDHLQTLSSHSLRFLVKLNLWNFTIRFPYNACSCSARVELLISLGWRESNK